LQKLNRRRFHVVESIHQFHASDFKLMRQGKKSWKIPYRSEKLPRWRQIGPSEQGA
jgi:hypothetical protein